MATAGGATDLYPAAAATEVDAWLATARGIEQAAAAWCQPTCQAASDEQRSEARAALEATLAQLDARLAGNSYLVRGRGWVRWGVGSGRCW